MIPIDPNLLLDLRLSKMTAGDRDRLVREISTALESRLGDTLARAMSDEEQFQFEQLQAQGDQAAMEQWLQQRFPDLQQIAVDELSLIKAEIKENGRIMRRNSSQYLFDTGFEDEVQPAQAQQPQQQPAQQQPAQQQPTAPTAMPLTEEAQTIQRSQPGPGETIDPQQ